MSRTSRHFETVVLRERLHGSCAPHATWVGRENVRLEASIIGLESLDSLASVVGRRETVFSLGHDGRVEQPIKIETNKSWMYRSYHSGRKPTAITMGRNKRLQPDRRFMIKRKQRPCPTSPWYLPSVVPIQALGFLPPTDMDIEELPVMLWLSAVYQIQNGLGTLFHGQVGARSTQIGLQPPLQSGRSN